MPGHPSLSTALSSRNKTVNGDCRRDPRERSRSPIERAAAPAVSLHGGHLYASLPSLMEQPLALTKNSSDTGRSAVERQQVCVSSGGGQIRLDVGDQELHGEPRAEVLKRGDAGTLMPLASSLHSAGLIQISAWPWLACPSSLALRSSGSV